MHCWLMCHPPCVGNDFLSWKQQGVRTKLPRYFYSPGNEAQQEETKAGAMAPLIVAAAACSSNCVGVWRHGKGQEGWVLAPFALESVTSHVFPYSPGAQYKQ